MCFLKKKEIVPPGLCDDMRVRVYYVRRANQLARLFLFRRRNIFHTGFDESALVRRICGACVGVCNISALVHSEK